MKLKFIFLLMLAVFSFQVSAQTKLPARLWTNRYVPSTGVSLYNTELLVDAGGNSYTISMLDSGFTNKKGFIRKCSAAGNLIFEKRLVNPNGNYYQIPSAVLDNSGNIIAITNQDSVGNRVFITKFDNNGNILWRKPIIRNSKYGLAQKVMIDASSNIYIGGVYSNPDNYFFGAKYNSNGDSIWTAVAANSLAGWSAIFTCMDIDASGNLIVAGSLKSNDSRYGWNYAKFSNGNTLFSRGGVSVSNPAFSVLDVKVNSSGTIFLCGANSNGFSSQRLTVSKINGTTGDGVWDYQTDSFILSNEMSQGKSMCLGNSNEIYVGGTEGIAGRYGIIAPTGVIIKLDTSGNLKFRKNFSDSVVINKILKDNTGNIFAAGVNYTNDGTNTKTFLYEVNSIGQIIGGDVYLNPAQTNYDYFLTLLAYNTQYGVYINASNYSTTFPSSSVFRYVMAVPNCITVTRTPNKSITDFQTTFDTLTFTGIPVNAKIISISVKFDTLTHTWPSDISAALTSVGRADTLVNRSGGNLLGNGFFSTVFNDSSALNIDSMYNPFTGTFRPVTPLYVFNQAAASNQKFIVGVKDNASGDVGMLKRWSINICYFDLNTVGVNNASIELPEGYKLNQNYPNPFNPVCKINYQIPNSGMVELNVYDIIGKKVASLVSGYQESGSHLVEFNGSSLSSGVYFYKLQSGNFSETRKMLLIK